MNRHELAIMLRQREEFSTLRGKTIEKLLQAAEQIILDTVNQGQRVSLLGFGSFYVRHTRAHTKHALLRGIEQEIKVPAKRKFSFHPSRRIEDLFMNAPNSATQAESLAGEDEDEEAAYEVNQSDDV